MAIKHIFLLVLIPVVMLLIFLLTHRSKQEYRKGKKIANTSIVKRQKQYKKYIKTYRILSISILVLDVIAIMLSTVMSSRIYENKTITLDEYSRDIMLCLDVSGSMGDLNIGVLNAFNETIQSLEHERVGISIFVSTSYLLVPLTEDYSYLGMMLTKLSNSIKTVNGSDGADELMYTDKRKEYNDAYVLLYGGTAMGKNGRGSSLIGDGLASCIYDFPDIETTSRSRNIIFITDNDVLGRELVTVSEAAEIAQQYGVKVFSVAPSGTSDIKTKGLKQASSLTGGEFYFASDADTAKEIVNQINQQEETKIESPTKIISIDHPEILFICLAVCIGIMFSVEWWINK